MYGSFIIVAIATSIVRVLLKRLHPTWWARREFRIALWVFVAMAFGGLLLRTWAMSAWVPGASAMHSRNPTLAILGVGMAAPGSVALLGLLLTLPLAAIVRAVVSLALRRAPDALAPAPSPVDELPTAVPASASFPVAIAASDTNARAMLPRRTLIEAAAATLPLAALGAGGVGIVGAFAGTRIIPRPMRFEGLPSDLQGLRILQLTDLHVGAFMDLAGIDALVEAASSHRPDMVVLTGDICDHLPWLAETLARVEELSPRLGIFGALGNHEHFRGLEASIAAYSKSTIDLLVNEARVVRVGASDLVVAGVDDPGRGFGAAGDHYARSIERALSGQPEQSLRLGLCHRPSGFPDLARAGIDLTLSGHTHGGQIGTGERSVFEGLAPNAHLWGRYAQGRSQLYTSSGGGHWFAFRLACPSEAALITLERA